MSSFKRKSIILISVLSGLFLFSLFFLLALPPHSAHAEIPKNDNRAVDLCFTSYNNTNTTAYSSADASAVQVAIDNASSGDLIKIAGTCTGVSVTAGITQTAYITKSLTLQGGYTSTNWTTQDPDTYTTTLDADRGGRVAVVTGTITTTLDSLYLTGGFIDSNGGGIWNYTATLTITNSQVISNIIVNKPGFPNESGEGGGLENNSGQVYIYDSTFANNWAEDHSGAIHNVPFVFGDPYGDVTIVDSQFLDNFVRDGSGGAIGSAGSLTVFGSWFIGNKADDNGGAISTGDGGPLVISDTHFISNTVDNDDYGGGALYAASEDGQWVHNSVFRENYADSSGGAIYVRDPLTVTHSIIVGNDSTVSGGGIYLHFGTLVISNTLIADNTTWYQGGGIYMRGGNSLQMSNSTVSGNEVMLNTSLGTWNGGGGVTVFGDVIIQFSTIVSNSLTHYSVRDGVYIAGTGVLTMTNSIVAYHDEDCNNNAATFTDGGYNLVEDASCISAGTSISGDPLLGPLADNGGDSWTHQLQFNSPARDVIPNATNGCGNLFTTDQRGYIRPFGTLCDIGAYEGPGAEVTSDVSLSKSVTPSTANVGDTITYTLTFSNSGEGLAQNVIITDEIPVEITNIISIGSGAIITPTGGTPLTWMVEDLSAGESGTITLIGQVDSALISDSTVTNTAIITTSTVEASAANNIAQVALNIRPRPVLHLEKSAFPAAPVAGEQMTYTIQINNASSFPATGVIISDVVPSQTTYVPGSITGVGGDATNDPNLVWNVGAVSLGNPITVTFAVTINSDVVTGTQIANTAAVSSSEVLTPVVGSAIVTVNQNVDLRISKSSQRENSSITYTLVISNQGPSAVSGAIVSDTIPAGIETASWMWQCVSSGGASCTAGPLNTNIADTVNLPVGGQLIYTVTATLTDSASIITNTATVTAPAGVTELVPADNTAVDISRPTPVAVDDAYNTNEDIPLTIAATGVISNDGNIDSMTATATVDSDVSNGALALASDGGFVYTPTLNFNGTDSFTYILSDGVLTDTAMVTITVSPTNDPPIAVDDVYTTTEGVTLDLPAPGVLANDTDVEDGLTAVVSDTVSNGSLTLALDGGFVYTPTADFCGVDSFTYVANDGTVDSNLATVTLNVTCNPVYKIFLPVILK